MSAVTMLQTTLTTARPAPHGQSFVAVHPARVRAHDGVEV